MKKTVCTSILIFTVFCLRGQIIVSPNTYYLIPPSSPDSCDGVWAIKDTLQCYTWVIDPCYKINHYNYDTLFLDLCSIPCEFIASTIDGRLCAHEICSNSTSINSPSKKELLNFRQDENSITITNSRGLFDEIVVFSITGQKIFSKKNPDNNCTIDSNYLPAGLYILCGLKSGEIIARQKFSIR